MVTGYNKAIAKLEAEFKTFVEDAKAGADGRGSKAPAMRARKQSGVITKSLKEFRKLSVDNDRSKAKAK